MNLYTLPKMHLQISGGEIIPLRLLSDTAFKIGGYTAESDITDTCCCENVWSAFYESDADKSMQSDTIYVSYRNQCDRVSCTIGQRGEQGEHIPASRWACFTLQTTDDDAVNEFYGKIIYEWLPSAQLQRRNDVPTIEIFPADMSQEGFQWEIRIPVI